MKILVRRIGRMVAGVPVISWESPISKGRSQMVFETYHKIRRNQADRLLPKGSFENSTGCGMNGCPIGVSNSMNGLSVSNMGRPSSSLFKSSGQ